MLEFVFSGGKYHDTRIEYVRPAHVWDGREFVREGKQVRNRSNGEDIGVEENQFGILS